MTIYTFAYASLRREMETREKQTAWSTIMIKNSIVWVKMDVRMVVNVSKTIQHVHEYRCVSVLNVRMVVDVNSP